MLAFEVQKFLILMKPNLYIFILFLVLLVSYLEAIVWAKVSQENKYCFIFFWEFYSFSSIWICDFFRVNFFVYGLRQTAFHSLLHVEFNRPSICSREDFFSFVE